jgi:hypothetical protein
MIAPESVDSFGVVEALTEVGIALDAPGDGALS